MVHGLPAELGERIQWGGHDMLARSRNNLAAAQLSRNREMASSSAGVKATLGSAGPS
jgi:hypothetical protein